MHDALNAVNDSTVAGLGRLARFFGFSDVMGRLYGTLLLSPEAMSLDDLANSLEISKGSVSMNMRALERWGMAKEVWMRGERKKFYAAESDLWQVVRNVLESRESREVQLALNVLGESVEKLKSAEDELSEEEIELARYYLERIGELQSFFQVAQLVITAVLGGDEAIDFEAVTKIDIEQS
jgi:DNA-binding transcriptional regulator GbsR (MarR family)